MIVLDLQTFAASTLANSEGLAAALGMLESCLAGPDTSLDLILQDLCSVPHLFEFVLSALPHAEGELLVRRILHIFPTNPAHVKASSASMLLRSISSVLFALPADLFPTDTVRLIGHHKLYIESALQVLDLLFSTDFLAHIASDESHVRSKKQKKPRGKNREDAPAMDVSAFLKLGAQVPMDDAEANDMAHEVTDTLRSILKFYLDLLLEPYLSHQFKNVYVSTPVVGSAIHPSVPLEAKGIEAVESRPSAYPKVQPMKAALCFENAEGFGEWRIIIGTDAAKKLREIANGDKKKCRIVMTKIKELSNGHFSDDNQKRLNGSSGIPIFEAKMQRDLRLVYQIDVISDRNEEIYRQVIKIYGIYTHTQLNRIWDAMGHHLAGKGKEYRRRCIFRTTPVKGSGNVYLPATFPPEHLQEEVKHSPLVLSEEDMGKLHSLLVLEKYVTFSQAFLHGLMINQDTQHVFELTPHERKIVDCTTSCYVLGRSGTGKTTTAVFKMLGIQRAWEMSELCKPRQIFVTKSRALATKVEEYFTKLLESLALVGHSRDDLKKMQVRNTEPRLVDDDDVARADIPQRYSELEENHFPLFVTFDNLAEMIAADVLTGADPEVQRLAKFFISTDEIDSQESFITYDVFARTYWPHFPQPLTKGLEPWLVFSEIMGIIKGSERSLSCSGGFLDEKAYCNLPVRSNPTFANQRRILYAIFEAYCKLKKERRHHDVADRTHAILRTLLGGAKFKGQKVDYLYIDEAQDNLLIDALLLRLICRNPEGLFWAGDTAQTISAGSSFRFDDLKAFLYRVEQDQSKHIIQDRSVNDPMAFQLAINYRSHGGIVNCAHSVIERITRFWPDAIDGLQPEHGIVNGLRPVFFRGWNQDTVRYEQFLFGESGSRIEFGAEQCILVRDQKAQDKLRKEVGEIGLIMTIYDSKGLEFNDVLLYNFFEDSAVDLSRWRVLLNHAEGIVDGQDLAKTPAPSFDRDESRFAGICSELKSLYVGITRARKNLWIFDKSDKSEPMRMIWTSRDQVQNCTPGTNVPHLAVSSTPEEWASSGHNLFKHKRYLQAMHCFARASLPREVAICEAFLCREVARSKVGVASQKILRDAFRTAADAFMASARDAPPGNDMLQYYHNAADCYRRAEDLRKAADGYVSAQEYDLAARCFRKAGLFDETLEVLHKHSQNISSETSEELYNVCRLFYCSKKDVNRPRLPLFSSFNEELAFLEDYDLDFALATLLETHGRYLEAAKVHLAENRPFDAIRDLLKEKGSCDAIQQATKIVLDGLWNRCSFAIPPKRVAEDQDVREYLKLACELPPEFLDPLDRNEIFMFRAIAHTDLPILENLAREFINGKRNMAALLALDHFFNHLPALESYTVLEMSQFLDKFREYIRLLHSVISLTDPLADSSIRRLFCVTEISNSKYAMALGSFLHSSVTGDHHGPQHSILVLSKEEIASSLQEYLAKHLRKRVVEENGLCCEAPVFLQCLTFVVTGVCKRINCPQEHVKSTDLDSRRYNIRIGIHLQQIYILQLMYSVNPHLNSKREDVLDWLTHLYEAFNPQFHVQGSIADLDLSVIPGSHEGLGVMKHWIQEAVYDLRANNESSMFLTTVLKLTSLLFAFDKASALKCINQARVPKLKYPDDRYVLEDIVRLFDGTQETCISSGLRFLKHVILGSLPVDLSVFCDCLEEVVGKISVSWCLSFDPPLNGLVLPKGWLASNKDFSSKKYTCIILVVEFLDCIRELLARLQSDSPSRLYKLSHTKLTPILRVLFTSRICRALCFLHFNVRNPQVRLKVKAIFDFLQTAGPLQRAHYLYRKQVLLSDRPFFQLHNTLRYTNADERDYLKVIVEYDAKNKVATEDVVQLLHKQRNSRTRVQVRLPRIKEIQFTNPSEIPSLLAAQLVVVRSDLRADAPTFVPKNIHVSEAEKVEDEEKVHPEEPEVELVDDDNEKLQEIDPAPEEPALICEHEPTEEELSAATKIQVAYRRHRQHREDLARAFGNGWRAQINTLFIACLKNISRWKKTPYRILYLWALPRLLVCLDKAIAIAHEFKRKTKGLLLQESHERLEELGEQINKINALLKRGRNLRKMIEPGAAMHQEKNKNAMKKAVLDVEDILYGLPSKVPSEIRSEFDVAYQLVMVEKELVIKLEKPALNTEDIQE